MGFHWIYTNAVTIIIIMQILSCSKSYITNKFSSSGDNDLRSQGWSDRQRQQNLDQFLSKLDQVLYRNCHKRRVTFLICGLLPCPNPFMETYWGRGLFNKADEEIQRVLHHYDRKAFFLPLQRVSTIFIIYIVKKEIFTL